MANDHRYSDKRTIGRIPPHNDDAEVALLGAVLLRNKVLEDVQTMIVKEDFYQMSHQLIWEAITGLHSEKPGVTIDLVSLSQYMRSTGKLAEAGGAAYVSSLTDSAPSSANAVYYAEIIRDTSIKRKLLNLSILMRDKALDEVDMHISRRTQVIQNLHIVIATGIIGNIDIEFLTCSTKGTNQGWHIAFLFTCRYESYVLLHWVFLHQTVIAG